MSAWPLDSQRNVEGLEETALLSNSVTGLCLAPLSVYLWAGFFVPAY